MIVDLKNFKSVFQLNGIRHISAGLIPNGHFDLQGANWPFSQAPMLPPSCALVALSELTSAIIREFFTLACAVHQSLGFLLGRCKSGGVLVFGGDQELSQEDAFLKMKFVMMGIVIG